MPIKNRIADMAPEISAWRRDLHANPELRFEEHRTSGFVADKLAEFGCDEVTTGIGQTGVVGVIQTDLAVAGIPSVSLRVGIPHYLMNAEHPQAVGWRKAQAAGEVNSRDEAVALVTELREIDRA